MGRAARRKDQRQAPVTTPATSRTDTLLAIAALSLAALLGVVVLFATRVVTTERKRRPPRTRRQFAARASNRACGRLQYVIGDATTLRPIWKRFNVCSALASASFSSPAPVRISDGEGQWVSSLHLGADLTQENLVHNLRLAGA